MAGEIEATIRGHLAADAVVKATPEGKEVCELRVAVGVRRKINDVWTDVRTDWVDVSAWNSLVGGAATLKSGQLVTVTGILTPGAYINKVGEAVPSTRLIASLVAVVPRAPQLSAVAA